MLILELGIWVLPLTLLLAPARRMVRIVDDLQRTSPSLADEPRRGRSPRCGAGSTGSTPPPSSRDCYHL
jgi:hypothetical protein